MFYAGAEGEAEAGAGAQGGAGAGVEPPVVAAEVAAAAVGKVQLVQKVGFDLYDLYHLCGGYLYMPGA